MLRSEAIALSLAAAAYVAGWLLAIRELASVGRPPDARVRTAILLGFAAHTAAIVIRWIAVGHPPVFGTFEAALADSWAVAGLTLVVLLRFGELREVPLVSLPMVLLLWTHGLGFNRKHFPLTISERSLWIDLHAFAAWVAFASYVLAFVLALFVLLPWRRPTEVLDEHMFRFTTWGFVAQSVMMASGAYYGFLLFGEWWRWDPVESLALVAWLAYALVIHLRLFFGWRYRRGAWATVASTLVLVASYKVIPHLPAGSTYHIFDLTL